MKKFIILSAILSFVSLFSQKTESKKPNTKSDKTIPNNPYLKLDSTNSTDLKEQNNNTKFYKNIDSAKALKYKMLNKKPSGEFLKLSKNNATSNLYQVEKPKDSVLIKKKNK